jgi:peptidoglycan-N-acetylglucosamine deacetylase
MKRISLIVAVLVLNLFCCKSFSKATINPYEIATWQGFRQGAISYTFDDNCPNQLAIAVPMFNKFGFKLTMFVPSDWVKEKDWVELQNAADNGHEIASHTVTHADFSKVSLARQLSELKNSKDSINAHIKGHSCITMAYPYCSKGNDSLCSSYYIAARGCQGYAESKTPGDFMNISSMVTGKVSSIQTVRDFNHEVEKADSINGWCVFLIHGIDNDGGYSPTQSSVLQSHLGYVKEHSDKLWVAPFGDVVRYIRERNAASVKELSGNKASITLQVSDNLNDSIYNYPITIRRVLPKKWKSATVTKNGRKVKVKISQKGALKYITFDVVPNGGDVILIKG